MEPSTAVYARQSVDKKDSISIESQIEFCKYETRGEKFREYKDKGFSGKNTDRPEFQRLVQDIKNGEISKVIVYKLDRISRSILDFAEMMQMFESYHVEFVSSTEKFDTSTPMGRAMLNICIVFAQLERETIQKRVTDAYHSRLKRGYYMGGKIPYGFKTERIIIDNIKTSKYIPIPEEIEQIRLIYEMYANPTTSVGEIMRYMLEHGMKNQRNKCWGKSTINTILKNPIYVQADLDVYEFYKKQGVNIINPPEDFIGTNGCYLYNENETGERKEVKLEGHTLVIAPHEGIVPSDIWIRTREKFLNNAKNKFSSTRQTKNTWLAGKIKCAKCNHALVVRKGQTRPGNIRRYFYCQNQVSFLACEGVKSIYADEIEMIVQNEIKEKLKEFQNLSAGKIKNNTNPKINELKLKEKQIDNEIENLMSKLINANEVLMDYINKRIVILDEEKRQIEEAIKALEPKTQKVDYKAIINHVEKWDSLSFEDKRNVLDILVEKVLVAENQVEIEWKI